ncbi:MAG: response regulator, partial [Acidimicrobiales bacterium]
PVAPRASVSTTLPRVLLVDDDPAVTGALRRQLRSRYQAVAASSAEAAVALVRDADEPFAAVVSDLRMPGTGGLALLGSMAALTPSTTRLLLTGHADLDTAIDALNGGHVFRFLCKPADQATMVQALDDAVDQHRLVTAEAELLQRTLHRSIDALLETLALTNPAAFSRALRVRSVVDQLLEEVEVDDPWTVQVASMVSQIGAVTLPATLIDKLHNGDPLDGDEPRLVDGLPSLALRLIADIPRLDDVRAILAGLSTASIAATELPVGARILRVALAFDELDAAGRRLDDAVGELRGREPLLDAATIDSLREARARAASSGTEEVALDDLAVGMVLATDVVTSDGVLLVGRGQTVTANLLARIANFDGRVDRSAAVRVKTA